MSLIQILMLVPAGIFLLGSAPMLAQSEPGIENDIPIDAPAPVETEPAAPEPSVETDITPNTEVDPSVPSNIGGAEGPNSLVQCGPSGAAFVVTKVPVGCHILDVNSPPGQVTNAESS